MQMRLRMLKHGVGKGRHVMKQLHMHASECCNATVATERAGYVLYRALVIIIIDLKQHTTIGAAGHKINYY